MSLEPTTLDRVTRRTGSIGICVLAEGGRSAACARDSGRVVQPGIFPGSRWYVGIEDKLTLARLGVALRRDVEGVATVDQFPAVVAGRGVGRMESGSSGFHRGLSAPEFSPAARTTAAQEVFFL